MIHEKRIPVLKSHKRRYFLKTDLIEYLKQGREKSAFEISEEADRYVSNKKGLNNGK
jgi:hypothetical protein